MKVPSILLFLLWLSICKSEAFDEGFYPAATSQMRQSNSTRRKTKPKVNSMAAEFLKINETAENADKILFCRSIDEIDIGIGQIDKEGKRHPIYFKRSEIEDFLKHEHHKDLLAVWFEKTMRFSDRNKLEITPFLSRLGYKRVLVLGFSSSGVFVILDTLSRKSIAQ